jgi:hypothetical protein
MKTLAVIQSAYIPWKGYFDIIHDSGEFVLYDTVQYVERSWQNRNQIKTPKGAQWITIPVKTKGKYKQAIQEAELVDHKWENKHFNTLQSFYSKAPFWKQYKDAFIDLYSKCGQLTTISEVNELFIYACCKLLGITTPIKQAREFVLHEGKTEKLIELCRQTGAGRYISGPAAKDYIIPGQFENAGVELVWKDYSGYPEYHQLHGGFTHSVSVLDLLFNAGDNAGYYIWGWRERITVTPPPPENI